jgi:hypothetical protein
MRSFCMQHPVMYLEKEGLGDEVILVLGLGAVVLQVVQIQHLYSAAVQYLCIITSYSRYDSQLLYAAPSHLVCIIT